MSREVHLSPLEEAFTMLASFDASFPGLLEQARNDEARLKLFMKRDELRGNVLGWIKIDRRFVDDNEVAEAFENLAAVTTKLLKKQFGVGIEEAQLEHQRMKLRNILETTCNQVSADFYLESERAAKRARPMPVGDGGAAAPDEDVVDLTKDDE